MIRLIGVSKTYNTDGRRIRALDDVSLAVVPSEFCIITGPSGAGKTTLLNCIGGMTGCDSGRIIIDGSDITSAGSGDLARYRRAVTGFIFQFQSMIASLNVIENVMLPSMFSGREPDRVRAATVLDAIGIGGRERAYARELSAGQQRRVAVAREMLRESKLLLCDEPTGDMDPDTEELVMRLIAERHRQGAMVLMATHNHSLRKYATRTIVMSNGRVLEA